jgi:hypothetical protein
MSGFQHGGAILGEPDYPVVGVWTDIFMSEKLLECLQVSFTSHGVECERSGIVIRARDGLAIEPRVFPREAVGGTAQVQVDFAVESPRLPGLAFLDSFAGVADTQENAEINAFSKFLRGSFHVIVDALTTHTCNHDQVEWEDWSGRGHSWRVCSGPLLLIATRSGSRIEGLKEFFPRLNELFNESMAAGPHWMRVFMGALDGKRMGSEVLVDGEVWPAGQALLDAHEFTFSPGYASFRHLLIALPKFP